MTGHVLLYVQHLLGVGHVQRAAAITRGIRAAGMNVTVAFGGCPVPHADFADADIEYLPAIRSADASFSALLTEHGTSVTDELWTERERLLLALYDRTEPTAILTEHFPFGRRKFKREIIPLFERARQNPEMRIFGSVRDILISPTDATKADKMIDLARTWYDAILVHGDPNIMRLEETFPQASQIADLLHYTGYIAESRDTSDWSSEDGHNEIIISAGGGAVGETLFQTALAARIAGCATDKTWRFLAGANLDPQIVATLREQAPDRVIIESARPDFPILLKRAALSVSQAGYNTMMDLIVAGCRGIVVPFATGGETEQTVRADTFARAELLTHLPETDLSPATLTAAVDAILTAPAQTRTLECDTDGIRTTGRMIAGLAN